MNLDGQFHGTSNIWEWIYHLPGWFICEKQAIWQLMKLVMSERVVEEILKGSGMSESQQKHGKEYGNYRRNRNFFFQVCTSQIIRICENLLVQEPSLMQKLDLYSTEHGAECVSRLLDECAIELAPDGAATEAKHKCQIPHANSHSSVVDAMH